MTATVEKQPVVLSRLPATRRFHLYCSPFNQGASELHEELCTVVPSLSATTRLEALDECDFCLVYLNGLTWTSGEASAQFAAEVEHAMRMGVKLMLAHETPGVRLAERKERGRAAFARAMDDHISNASACAITAF